MPKSEASLLPLLLTFFICFVWDPGRGGASTDPREPRGEHVDFHQGEASEKKYIVYFRATSVCSLVPSLGSSVGRTFCVFA